MKYKRLNELSNADKKVLNNISRKIGYGVMYIEFQYTLWDRGKKVDKMLEREFEKAFLSDLNFK